MSIKNYLRRKYQFYRYLKRVKTYEEKDINNIAIIFFIPKSNKFKYDNWDDGFTQAIKLLSKSYNISWINLDNSKPTAEYLNGFDFLIIKSCWDWVVDKYVQSLKGLKIPKGIAISCSKMPKNLTSLYYYDVLWYETSWYGQLLKHPRKFQAFGINTNIFYEQNLNKIYDVISIGALAKYKRHDYILNIKGDSKIVIGDIHTSEAKLIKEFLNKNNVKIIDFTNQKELSQLINKSKLVYIPAEINGGGERAVLEARACNVEVKVENDNPKLKELLESKIWNEKDYYNNLLKGIKSITKKHGAFLL